MVRDDLLLYFHKASDRKIFFPVHFLGRAFYRGPLRSYLKLKTGQEVIVRHSSANGVGFNLFSSDLDCTLIISSAFTLGESDEVRGRYDRLRSQLPMLGELELFSKSEWEMLQTLTSRYGPLLSLLRDLKKIRWMEWKLAKPIHAYHSSKAQRSIERVLKKYEKSFAENARVTGNHRLLGAGFSRQFKKIVKVEKAVAAVEGMKPDFFSMHSREIDATIGNQKDSALCLDADTALCLLSLYPSHEDDDASLLKLYAILRKTPELAPLHVAILKHDLIYANASPRIHTQYRATSWQWTESLIRQLRACATQSDFDATLSALNYHPSDQNGFIR